jgi:NAD-dependent dihydropyrimidine dehydrogenase PreA subunit
MPRMSPQPIVVFSRVPPEEAARHAPAFEALADELTKAGVVFSTVDSIYDQDSGGAGCGVLRDCAGDLVVIGWHYPRALKWILARLNLEVDGRARTLHCIDARAATPGATVARIHAILAGKTSAVVAPPSKAAGIGQALLPPAQRGAQAEQELAAPDNVEADSRWYPVIDYDQCTNCMECMDFCLFGVYGVDHAETLRVVNQDLCRQDCPACSRVCPVGAIMFPKYQTNRVIAGADEPGERGEIKLDLSAIFGKPKGRHQAALERDRELVKAGRKLAAVEKIEKLADDFDKLTL